MSGASTELAKLREEIDRADEALIELFRKRFAIVDRVIDLKRGAGLPAMIPDRIEQVVRNVVEKSMGSSIPPETMERLWRLLIAETIAYEEKRLTVK